MWPFSNEMLSEVSKVYQLQRHFKQFLAHGREWWLVSPHSGRHHDLRRLLCELRQTGAVDASYLAVARTNAGLQAASYGSRAEAYVLQGEGSPAHTLPNAMSPDAAWFKKPVSERFFSKVCRQCEQLYF